MDYKADREFYRRVARNELISIWVSVPVFTVICAAIMGMIGVMLGGSFWECARYTAIPFLVVWFFSAIMRSWCWQEGQLF